MGLLLGGSWVFINSIISPLRSVLIMVTLLITPLVSTHEPPSRVLHGLGCRVLEWFRVVEGLGVKGFGGFGFWVVYVGCRVSLPGFLLRGRVLGFLSYRAL